MNHAGGGIIGRSLSEVNFPETYQAIKPHVERALAGERVDFEQVLRFSDGRSRRIHGVYVPDVGPGGEVHGFSSMVEDITARSQLEEQLRQSQKLEAVGQLAGGVAHEFNNILQIIKGFVGLGVEAAAANGELRMILTTIDGATDRASRLVKQLLGFGKRQTLEPAVLDLNDLIFRLVELVQPALGEDILLNINSGKNLRPCWGDKGSIEQILTNLCLNARDAMPQGGRLTIETANAALDDRFCLQHPWAAPGEFVRISVKDTGEGMTDQVRERVFEPFFTTKALDKGSGLGLATAYGLIQQHQGLIHVTSALGEGTTFEIYLPAAAKGEEAEPADAGEFTATILVAEDDSSVQLVAARTLEMAGYRVIKADDGEIAVRLFQANADEVDLVLLDMVMPNLDGRGAYEKITAIRPDIPVLFHTAYNLGNNDAGFLANKNLGLLQKPYPPNALRKAVRELLAPRQSK